MASIAIMIGGAILNATAFIGGSYIANSFSKNGNSDAERKRHDLALEKYSKDWQTYQKKKEQFEEWQHEREKNKNEASEYFQTMDEVLQQYHSTHPDFNNSEPVFSDYYQPSGDQKKGELLYVGGGMLILGYLSSNLF